MQNSDGRNALDTCISKRHGSGTALASMVARRANRNHAESKRGEKKNNTITQHRQMPNALRTTTSASHGAQKTTKTQQKATLSNR